MHDNSMRALARRAQDYELTRRQLIAFLDLVQSRGLSFERARDLLEIVFGDTRTQHRMQQKYEAIAANLRHKPTLSA